MISHDDSKATTSAFFKMDDQDVRMERFFDESGLEKIRITIKKGENISFAPIVLSEKELLEILHQAILAGVLHDNFSAKLREKFEI